MNSPELSVVIPAFNEEQKIERDIDLADAYLKSRGRPYELIVVDDGSADQTAARAESLTRANPNLRVIRLPRNMGKGAAVRAGMQAARGENALFSDAGTCVPYDNIERGLAVLSQGADAALGSRAIARSRIVKYAPFYRRLGSMGFQFVVEYVMGLKSVADTQCGFKLFTRKAYRDIFSNLVTDGFMFDVEILLYAQWRKLDTRFFPVEWSNDPDTRFKPVSGSIRNFKELCKIKWRMRSLIQGRVEIQTASGPG